MDLPQYRRHSVLIGTVGNPCTWHSQAKKSEVTDANVHHPQGLQGVERWQVPPIDRRAPGSWWETD